MTCHGRPFSLIEDTAFQKLVKPFLTALPQRDTSALTVRKVQDDVRLAANNMREQIKTE